MLAGNIFDCKSNSRLERHHSQCGTQPTGKASLPQSRACWPCSAWAAPCWASGSAPAAAQRIENSVAIFAALDKVTAKISKLEVPLNQTAKFGALKITPRACYTRAPTEPPKTTTFVEVDEVMLDDKEKRIFAGWMFADSPGLNAVEHPVFDVWLTECTAPVRTARRRRPKRPIGHRQRSRTGSRP